MFLWAGSSWGQNIFFDGFETGNTHNTAIAGWTQASVVGAQVWTANNTLTTYNRSPRTGAWNAFLRYSNTDWMFKQVTLTGGTNYKLGFYARQDATSGCNILASYGTAGTIAGMTNSIIASTAVTSGSYQYFSGTFTPPSSGTYYIGIRANLTGTPWYISIDDISLDVTPPSLLAVPGTINFGYVPSGDTYEYPAPYVLSGSYLTAGPVVVTAPSADFEVSLTGGGAGFGPSVNVTYTPPALAATNIYVRFKPTGAPANYSGNITNVGGGASTNVSVSGTSRPPLAGTYYVGTASKGDYSTLTAAVSDLNSLGISASVTFLLTDATYPSETFPITINQVAGASATKTVTIKPDAGVTTAITGTVNSNAVIKVLSSYVVIDGSDSPGGTSRNLTITNNSTTSPNVLLIGSTGTTPVTGTTVENCILVNGVTTSTALVVSDGTTLGNAGYFSNITLQNNSIQKAYIGIYAIATVATGNGSGLLVTGNDFSTSGSNAIAYIGIYVQGVDGATVSKNAIGNFDGTGSQDDAGIWFATGTVNSTIAANSIYALNYPGTGGYGVHGIKVSTGVTNCNVVVKNNFIYNLSGDGYAYSGTYWLDNPYGIVIYGTQTGVKVYFNSINLYGNTLNQTSALSAGIALGTGSTADLKDNIIVNNLGLLSGTGYGSTGIFLQSAISQLEASDYNDIFISPTGSGAKNIGQVSTTGYTSLGTWQPATGKDAHSISGDPKFVSNTDLHINTSVISPVSAAGFSLAPVVTDDIDGDPRLDPPDIGADEFTSQECTVAEGGTATGSETFCGPGTPDIAATGYSTGIGTTYQWMYSTNSGDYPAGGSEVTGQNDPDALVTGEVSTDTYYWLKVECASKASTAYSTMVTITILPPAVAHISGPTAKCFEDPEVTLTEDGGTGASWLWSNEETTQSIDVAPASTTTYTVTVTGPGPCTKTASFTLTVNPNPSGVSASSSVTDACYNVPFDLYSTADPIAGGISENFDGGTAPALPAGWVAFNNAGPAPLWVTSTASFYSSPNAAYINNPTVVSDKWLTSPSILIQSSTAQLTFRNSYYLESGFDGGVLEISIDGGAFTDILAAGGSFVAGGYSATISTSYSNPIGGRSAWTGNSGGFIVTTVNLPASAAGKHIVLRWRMGSDTSAGNTGWYIDDVVINDLVPPSFSWTSDPPGFTSSDQNPTGLTQTEPHTYYVTVTGIGGCTSTTSVYLGVIEAPGTPVVSVITPVSFDLTWTYSGITVPDHYSIEVATDDLFNNQVAGSPFTVNHPTLTFTVPGLSGSTTYYYRMKAVGDCETAFTTPGSVMTLCPAVTAPFTENFEIPVFAPACWANTIVDGSFLWDRSTAASAYGQGTASARANFWNQAAGAYELRTVAFDASGLAEPTLRFSYAYATYVVEIDELDVYYSTNYGRSWLPLIAMPGGVSGILNTAGAFDYSFVPTPSQWAMQTIALPAGTNMLKFTAISAYGNNLYLDNITVDDAIPAFVTVDGEEVTSGQTNCYDATNTLTLQNSTVRDGGSATFIAGEMIRILPDVHAESGSYMHCYISKTFCDGKKAPSIPEVAAVETTPNAIEQAGFLLFPNPTTGDFTLMRKGDLTGDVTVQIYGMRGDRVMTERMTGEKSHLFSLSGMPDGLYFVKVTTEGVVETMKVIKTR